MKIMANESTNMMQMLKIPRGSVESMANNPDVSVVTLPILITDELCHATQSGENTGFYDSQIGKPAYVKLVVPTEGLRRDNSMPIDPASEGPMFFSESKKTDLPDCMFASVLYGIMSDAYDKGYQAEKLRRQKLESVKSESAVQREENVLAVQLLASVKTEHGSRMMHASDVPDGKDVKASYNVYHKRAADGTVYSYGFSVQNPELAKTAGEKAELPVSGKFGYAWIPAKYVHSCTGGVEIHIPKNMSFSVGFRADNGQAVNIDAPSDSIYNMIKNDQAWRMSRIQTQKDTEADMTVGVNFASEKSEPHPVTSSVRPQHVKQQDTEMASAKSDPQPVTSGVKPQRTKQQNMETSQERSEPQPVTSSVRPQRVRQQDMKAVSTKANVSADENKMTAQARTEQMVPPSNAATGQSCHYLLLPEKCVYTVSANPDIRRVTVGLNNSPENRYGCREGSLGLVTVPTDDVVKMTEIPEGYLNDEMGRTVKKWENDLKLKSKMNNMCVIRLYDTKEYPVKIDAKHSYTGKAEQIRMTGFDINNYNVVGNRSFTQAKRSVLPTVPANVQAVETEVSPAT